MNEALSDDEIMAYADGELPEPRRRAVQRAWACDPEVRQLVHVFRRTQLLTGEAYADLGDETTARGFADELLRVPRVPATRFGTGAGHGHFPSPPAMAAIACTALFMVAAGVTLPLTDPLGAGQIEVGVVRPGSVLSRRLDAAVAGHHNVGDGPKLVIAEQLTDKLGNACWEIDVYGAEQFSIPATVFVACRNANLSWSVIAAMRTTPFQSNGERPYVIEARDAHRAFSGILETIRLKQQTTEIKDENPKR